MALHDLTPQLRTRLSRMERAVGWFVILATALLAFGFVYYVYNTAERKGWFKTKAPYFTFTDRGNWALAQEVFEVGGTNVLYKALTPATNLAAVAAAGYDKVVLLNTSAKRNFMTGVWDQKEACYQLYNKKKSKPYWLISEESAAVTE